MTPPRALDQASIPGWISFIITLGLLVLEGRTRRGAPVVPSPGPGAAPMPRRDDAPRDLLFGLLALQNGLVTRDQLVLAFAVLDRRAGQAPGRPAGRAGRPAARAPAAARRPGRRPPEAPRRRPRAEPRRPRRQPLHPREPRRRRRPDVEATLAHVGSGSIETATPTGPPATPSAPPPPTASGSASSGPTPAAAWAPSSSPSTPSCNREVALKQILDRPRRRPGQPHPVPPRGRDHRRAGAPGHRPGLRPGDLRRRPAVLRDAVHPGRHPQGGDRPLPRRRDAQARPRPAVAGAAQAAAAVHRRLQRHRVRPQPAACSTATSSRAT